MGLTEESRIWGTGERVSDDSEQSKKGEPARTPPRPSLSLSLSPRVPERGAQSRGEQSEAEQKGAGLQTGKIAQEQPQLTEPGWAGPVSQRVGSSRGRKGRRRDTARPPGSPRSDICSHMKGDCGASPPGVPASRHRAEWGRRGGPLTSQGKKALPLSGT